MAYKTFEEIALEAYTKLANGMGFKIVRAPSGKAVFIHKKMQPCPHCGDRGCIEPSMYEPGKWLAICLKCAMRTVLVGGPIKAVRAWNEGHYTEDSLLVASKLTRETMTNIGAMNLTEAMKRAAVRDLIQAEAHGGLDTKMAKDAIWFINNEQVVKDIIAGNRRKELGGAE